MRKFIAALDGLSVGVFSLVLLVVNAIQAGFTELSGDEALYTYYAQHMSWGYFDHPPMIALYVWLGSSCAALFGVHSSELAVRAATVLSFSLSVYVLWLAVKESCTRGFFITTVLAFFLPHVFGFISTPDAPLFLFTSLFLWQYQLYCGKATVTRSLVLGLCMAAMLYSKYHTALFLLFIVLGNFNLLRQWQSWLAFVVALLCYTPHLWWQYSHHFPTLQYHVAGRATAFRWTYLLEYAAALFGAYALFAVPAIFVVLRSMAATPYLRSVQVTNVGFILFFAAMTIRGHVQAQWLMMCVPPIIILLCQLLPQPKMKYVQLSGLLVTIVLCCLRIFLVIPQHQVASDFFGRKKLVAAVQKYNTQALPIVVHNSYQFASLMRFYGQDSSVYNTNNFYGRQGEYQVHYTNDAAFNNTEVLMLFSEGFYAGVDTLRAHPQGKHLVFAKKMRYTAYDGITLPHVMQRASHRFDITIYNPYTWPISIDSNSVLQLWLCPVDEHKVDLGGRILTPIQTTFCAALDSVHFTATIDTAGLSSVCAYTMYLRQASLFDGPALAHLKSKF